MPSAWQRQRQPSRRACRDDTASELSRSISSSSSFWPQLSRDTWNFPLGFVPPGQKTTRQLREGVCQCIIIGSYRTQVDNAFRIMRFALVPQVPAGSSFVMSYTGLLTEHDLQVLKQEGIIVQRPKPFETQKAITTPMWSIDRSLQCAMCC